MGVVRKVSKKFNADLLCDGDSRVGKQSLQLAHIVDAVSFNTAPETEGLAEPCQAVKQCQASTSRAAPTAGRKLVECMGLCGSQICYFLYL